jgi:hypothetical protein
MKNSLKTFSNHIFLFCSVFFSKLDSLSQHDPFSNEFAVTNYSFDIRDKSFLLPQAQPAWKYSEAVSFSYIDLPQDWTLNQINAPTLGYSGKLSLPAGFDMQANLSTMIISNRLEFGPFWNYSVDHVHLGIGWQSAYSLGFLNQFGYKTTVTSWEQEPTIIVGHSFRKFALTLRANLELTNSIQYNEGGHKLPENHTLYNGYSVSASFEQRLYKNKVVQLTIKINSLKYEYHAWPVFPGDQSRYLLPEFKIGINL